MQPKNSFVRTVKEYAVITLGLLLYVTGWGTFLVSNNLVGGGVTGISSIIQYATNGRVLMGTSYFIINVGLMIAGFFVLGKSFSGKTIYAIILASVGLNLCQQIIPQEIIQALSIDNGKLMSTLMGGLMVGTGVGLCISQGGSTGGTDIIALIVNKYRNVSPGRMLLTIDIFIILSSLLVPSYTADGSLVPVTDKVTTVVYGFILVVVNGMVADMCISGMHQSVQVFIFSKKYEEIANAIVYDMHRGTTVLDGQGWYSKEPAKVVMVLTRKTDLSALLRYVKSIDSDAFVSVGSVTGVYGKGFDTIKNSKKK